VNSRSHHKPSAPDPHGVEMALAESELYADCCELAGSPRDGDDGSVKLRPTLDRSQHRALLLLVAANASAELCFLGWLVGPGHWRATLSQPRPGSIFGTAALLAIVVIELVRLVQVGSLWVFALNARDPVPMRAAGGLRVALVTTIVPSCEPVALVARTLAAMRCVDYPGGTVDVWILDEGDDPQVQAVARRLGVRHFSRRGKPECNTASGPFRARTKAGNHNAWLAAHGRVYDVVAQLDPDHVPGRHLLERTLGYFRDPDVAFVVAPQVYGNAHAGLVRHGAAAQAFLFHGVIQRGCNGLGAPLLIGTNHVYRTEAMVSIGGYQDSIIEDHLTSMTLHATVNPRTARRWKGIYTPDVLAVGQAPATWGDFFTQQQRWAYGAAEIALRHSWRLRRKLARPQRVAYALLQSFYPGVALTWVLGTGVTIGYLTHASTPPHFEAGSWGLLWTASVATTLALLLWLRRLNLAPYERRELGGTAILATLCAGPIYVAAVTSAALGRPLAYRVTPKGSASRSDRLGTFRRHLVWLAVVMAALMFNVLAGTDRLVPCFWALVTIGALAMPPAMHVARMLRRQCAPSTSSASTVRVP